MLVPTEKISSWLKGNRTETTRVTAAIRLGTGSCQEGTNSISSVQMALGRGGEGATNLKRVSAGTELHVQYLKIKNRIE